MSKRCKQCNRKFFKKPSHSMSAWETRTHFCSRSCSDSYRRGKPSNSPSTTFKKGNKLGLGRMGIRGAASHLWKGGQFKKVCAICVKGFSVDRDRADAKTCSMECNKLYRKTEEFRLHLSDVQRSKIPEGMKIVHDVLSKFVGLLRRSARYGLWRERIFKRDNFICQSCGIRGGKLQADHIKPWELYPALRFALDNGRTLCVKCHYKTDTYGGKIKKTNKQK